MLAIIVTSMLAADCTFERVERVTDRHMERTCYETYYDWREAQRVNPTPRGAVSRINDDGEPSITTQYVLDVLGETEL